MEERGGQLEGITLTSAGTSASQLTATLTCHICINSFYKISLPTYLFMHVCIHPSCIFLLSIVNPMVFVISSGPPDNPNDPGYEVKQVNVILHYNIAGQLVTNSGLSGTVVHTITHPIKISLP